MVKIREIKQNGNTISVHLENGECHNFPVESISDKNDLKQKVKDRRQAITNAQNAGASKLAQLKQIEQDELDEV